MDRLKDKFSEQLNKDETGGLFTFLIWGAGIIGAVSVVMLVLAEVLR